MDTSGDGGRQAEDGGLPAWLAQGSSEAADRYREARKAAASGVAEAKTGVVGVQGDCGEGLLVSLKEVLADHLGTQEGKAGLENC